MTEKMTAQTIADKIEPLIAAGAEGYRFKDQLLNVRALGEQEGVSAQTASAAYQILAMRGLVVTTKKSGTRVTGAKTTFIELGTFDRAPDWNKPVTSTDEEGDVTETTLTEFEVTEASGLAEWGIADGTRVTERHYTKTTNGAPVQHKVTYMPYEYAEAMPQDASYQGVPPMLSPKGQPVVSPPRGINMSQWLGWGVDDYVTEYGLVKTTEAASKALGVPVGTPMMGSICKATTPEGKTVFMVLTTQSITAKFRLIHK